METVTVTTTATATARKRRGIRRGEGYTVWMGYGVPWAPPQTKTFPLSSGVGVGMIAVNFWNIMGVDGGRPCLAYVAPQAVADVWACTRCEIVGVTFEGWLVDARYRYSYATCRWEVAETRYGNRFKRLHIAVGASHHGILATTFPGGWGYSARPCELSVPALHARAKWERLEALERVGWGRRKQSEAVQHGGR